LHFDKIFAERIGTGVEFLTGEFIAIPEAMADFLFSGTGEDRTSLPKKPVLGIEFISTSFTMPGTTGATNSANVQSANRAIDTACSSGHSLSLLFLTHGECGQQFLGALVAPLAQF
jgi:hypothetical protein